MKSKVAKILLRVGVVSTSIIMGIALTAGEITAENRLAISTNLNQPTFKVVPGEGAEHEDTQYFKSKYSNLADLVKDGKQLTEDIVAEGAVLLENNGALPLKANEKKVSLVGVTSELLSYGGRGSAHTSNPLPPTTLKAAMEAEGLQVNKTLADYYKKVCYDGRFKPARGNESASSSYELGFDEISQETGLVDSIKDSDVAIYTVARASGEGGDLTEKAMARGTTPIDIAKAQKRTLNFSDGEKSILSNLAQLKKDGHIKKIILVLNMTNQIEAQDFLKEYGIDAILWTGHLGVQGAAAVAKIITGTVNPSGHLPDTFYYDHAYNPVTGNHKSTAYSNKGDFPEFEQPEWKGGAWGGDKFGKYYVYQEGVYVGYRYSETRYTDKVNNVANVGDFDYSKVIYKPFGYGLSYTTFAYSNFKVNDGTGDTFNVSVDVKNTGEVAGKDAVQLYIQKPYGEFEKERGIEVPAVELVEYEKTPLIQPGKTETITLTLDKEALKVYDRKVDKTFIVSEGEYGLTVASDAHQAANNFLTEAGKSTLDGMTEEGNANLVHRFTATYDKTTYATSKATNKPITNLFEEYDMNTYHGKDDDAKGIHNSIEYLSRSNWSKALNNKLLMTSKLVEDLKRQTNSDYIKALQKPGDTYPTYGKAVPEGQTHDIQLIKLLKDKEGNEIAYDDPRWDEFLDQLTWDETAKLVTSGMRLTIDLQSIGKPGTTDHNGPTGLTETYEKNPQGLASKSNDPLKKTAAPYYPSIPVVAATFSKEIATRFGNMLGEDALWTGYAGFYGIGLNTHRSAYAGRQFEYFSEDPFLAGTQAAHQVKALQAKGCNAYIKHFALNDQEDNRNNVHIWSNEQALREISLRPFELAVTKGGAFNAMTSFTRIGADQVPGSKALLTDWLRGECGMRGLVVTDMFQIGYKPEMIPAFISAGCDLPDGNLTPDILNAYKTGYPTLANQMRESVKRICYHTLKSNAMNGISANTKIVQITPPWEKAMISVKAVSIVLFTGVMGWLAVTIVLDNKSKFLKK